MASCLIVDDSPIVRRILMRTVKQAGFEVREAGNGWEALVACAADMPDVVLLDWRMPLMDGSEFIRELRRCFDDADPVVILCATADDLPRAKRALGTGVQEYIAKPFSADIVCGKLRRAGMLRLRATRAAAA